MIRPLSLAIGIRYFRSGRRDGFLSLVSWISLLGMFLGVLSLIVVMSVMNGFEAELRQRVLSLVPHGFVDGPDGRLSDWQRWADSVEQQPGIVAAAPYVGGSAMLLRQGNVHGVQLYAIDPEREKSTSAVAERIVEGRYLSADDGGSYGILLGDILARQLRVSLGDSLTVVLPRVTVTPLGLFPREKSVRVIGLFSAGAQLDSTTAFMHLRDGQRLYQSGEDVQGLRVQVDDLYAAPARLAALKPVLPEGVAVTDWSQTQGSLFSAVKMEKRMVRLLLLFIVLIAAFNIISILTMAVSEKRSAIAVLRTMGARPASIMFTFVVYGMLTGVIGILLGVLLGVPLAMNVGPIVGALEGLFGTQVFNPQVYFITAIPSRLQWLDVLSIAAAAVSLSLLATLYPAWRASKIQPAEALRYE